MPSSYRQNRASAAQKMADAERRRKGRTKSNLDSAIEMLRKNVKPDPKPAFAIGDKLEQVVYAVTKDAELYKFDGKNLDRWGFRNWEAYPVHLLLSEDVVLKTEGRKEARIKCAEIAVEQLEEFICGSVPEQFNEKNEMYSKGDEKCPFFSEAYLYTLIGKEDARSVLALLSRLKRALGMRQSG